MPYLRAALIRKRAKEPEPPVISQPEPEANIIEEEQAYVVVSAVYEPQEAPEEAQAEAPEIEGDKLISALLNVIDDKTESIQEINEPAGADESVYVLKDGDDGSDIQEVPEEKELEPEGSSEGINAEVQGSEEVAQPDAAFTPEQKEHEVQPEALTDEDKDPAEISPEALPGEQAQPNDAVSLEPEAASQTLQPETQPGEQSQPDEAVSLEPEAASQTLQPETQPGEQSQPDEAVSLEPEAASQTLQPETQPGEQSQPNDAVSPKPEAQSQTLQLETQPDEQSQQNEAVSPEPGAQSQILHPETQSGEQIQPDEAPSSELEQPQEEQDAITHSEDFDENSLLDDGTSELTQSTLAKSAIEELPQSQPDEFKLQYDFTSGERYVDKVSTKTEFDKMLDELSSISKDLLAWEVEKFAKQYTNKFQDSSGDYAKKYEAFLGGYITNAAMLLDDNGYRDLALKQLDQAKSILEARKRLEEERQAIIARTEEQNDTVDLSDILGLFGDG